MAVGRFKKIILGTGLTGTDNADDTITLEATAAPASRPRSSTPRAT